MNFKFRVYLFAFVVTTVSGCTLFPGGHVDVDLLIDEPSYDIIPQISVKLITPKLIMESKKSEPFAQFNPQLKDAVTDYSYTVGKGDILNITVWDHPELPTPAGQFRSAGESGNVVHSDGTIFYPYVGRIHVINKTVAEIRDLVASLLGKYIKSPQIDISVAAYRSQRVFVTGAVNNPSVLPVTDIPMTILDALNLSGGISDDADWRSISLSSDVDGNSVDQIIDLYALYQKGDMTQNRVLKNNDILHIPRNDSLKLFVMGDVLEPSTQLIGRNSMTLAEALNNAGGFNERSANSGGIFVLRASKSVESVVDVFQLDASDGPMLILSTQFELEPLDIVYVTSAPIARWNRVISQLLPTFNLLRLAGEADSDFDR